MIRVQQQETDKGTGDCMRAAIASVLELDLQAVPHFTRTDEHIWFSVLYYFMIPYKYIYAGIWYPKSHGKRNLKKSDSIDGYYLAVVDSRNYPKEDNVTHMVVMGEDWRCAHDPHPSKSWQGKVLFKNPGLKYIYKFRKMNATDKKYWDYVL